MIIFWRSKLFFLSFFIVFFYKKTTKFIVWRTRGKDISNFASNLQWARNPYIIYSFFFFQLVLLVSSPNVLKKIWQKSPKTFSNISKLIQPQLKVMFQVRVDEQLLSSEFQVKSFNGEIKWCWSWLDVVELKGVESRLGRLKSRSFWNSVGNTWKSFNLTNLCRLKHF